MKVIQLLSIFSLAIFVPFFSGAQSSAFNHLQLKDLKGSRTTLEKSLPEDKYVILSFWATWCGPCKKELDAIKNNYADWQEKYNVELYAISTDDARTAGRVKSMVAQKKWPYEVLLDPEGQSKQIFNFQSIPFTVLLNKDREIVYSRIGYSNGDENKIEEKLAELNLPSN
ncbi:TlpA family protein disulfide reductase [Membranihabitans maritimus]|uniref:TlpA family protein disulfide reductase n=1 Tax=Membranihabitans maritimus TaxID=2904244 RepID=UPI001F36169F|nr:TlpA disulfide reductase family protein [Membranihabitans maritimus]